MPANNDEMKETWLPIKGYEGLYEISNFGNVKRLPKIVHHPCLLGNNSFFVSKEIMLKHNILRGYHQVTLMKDGKQKGFKVHRLVAFNFIGEPPGPEYQINHIDGNKGNNHVSNLEWVTPMQNTHHAIRTGLRGNLTEEQLKHMSEASKRTWQREDYRRKQSEQQKASWAKNKAERSLAIKEGIRRAKDGRKEIQQEIQ